jgi:Calcineurin-like phosphoesterase.
VQRIFVGDVQGCADELEEILCRARARFGTGYELWAVGDLVNRGPASLRVLERVRELQEQGRARLVLGNHEVGLLECALGLRSPGPHDTASEILRRPDAGQWIDWILGWPLVETGQLGERPFAMVHAAVHPDWDLATLVCRAGEAVAPLRAGREPAQRHLGAQAAPDAPADVLRRLVSCRSVCRDGSWSAQPPERLEGARPWHAAFAATRPAFGVVYGHWALQGLHVAQGLRGLDTGCVHHGRSGDRFLTAWLPDESRSDPFSLPDSGFWQVRAQRRYWPESP